METREFLFLVTYGRTGSTLLQGLLNELPGVRVFGENCGALRHLMASHAALTESHLKLQSPEDDLPQNPFFGSSRYRPDRMRKAFLQLVDEVLFSYEPNGERVDARIVGFKEIRHIFIGQDALDQYLDQLDTFFSPRFVFLTRRIEDVLASGWWAQNDPRHTTEQILRFQQTTEAFTRRHSDQCFHVDYDELLASPKTFIELGQFLGVEADPSRYTATVSRPHSYDQRRLTVLSRGGDSRIRLIDPAWWDDQATEFDIRTSESGEHLSITGYLVPKNSQATTFALRIQSGQSAWGVDYGLPSAEMAQRLPWVAVASVSGFSVSIPRDEIGQNETLELVAEGRVIAEIKVLA